MKNWINKAVGGSTFFGVLRDTVRSFDGDGVMKYCASLSFYTLFAIAPLLILALAIGGLIFGADAVNGRLFGQIHGVVGTDAAIAIQGMLSSASQRKDGFVATLLSIVVFFVGATGVFAEIQSTINRIWGLKAKPKKGILRYLVSRLWSFVMVIVVGLLLVFSLLAGAAIDLMNNELERVVPGTGVLIFIVQHLVTLGIITLFFALIFKYLPDSVVVWRDALAGALFTAVLFLLGKYLIGLYLGSRTFTSAYGAAGSLIVILLWIYYSSVLLYFGAEFTRVYALKHGHGIRPNNFSVRVFYQEKEVQFRDSDSGD